MTQTITLIPGIVDLATLEKIWREQLPCTLDASIYDAVKSSARKVEIAVQNNIPIYGINTGFGKLASIRIPPADTKSLQRNLILSHCAGVGEITPRAITRLMMTLKLISLGRGASGVRPLVIEMLERMLTNDITPVVPAQGSVGASGDLAPLAHMAAVMIGEGEAFFGNDRMSGSEALHHAGLNAIELSAKEGLALINGTQFSTAYALAGLFDAWHAASSSLLSSALSIDAAMASTAPLLDEIHQLRGHPGQIEAAATIRKLLAGSNIRDSHRNDDTRVQDPYCMRCQPQVVGAAMDLLRQAGSTLQREANAVTDNPLVLASEDRIVSGGNFHAEPVAFAADMIAIAMAEIGSISQRRIALLVDPTLSFDLPAFLATDPGLNSGMMIAEVTSAALMSENKHLANPCSTDSTPTSANQEDHVSMAAHGARRLQKMAENLFYIIGIEIFCAAEGIRHRAPLNTSPLLSAVLSRFNQKILPLDKDRYMAPDLYAASQLARSFDLHRASHIQFPTLKV